MQFSLSVIAALTIIAAAPTARADEQAISLKAGAGQEVVANQCAACHSLDYIQMNSSFLDAKGWGGEVKKMISVFGASIDEADAKTIADYLTANYGR